MLAAVKGPVEAAKEWLGARSWLRGTNGSPEFSDAATYLYALAEDAKAIDAANQGKGAPSCALPGFVQLAKFMAEARAGQGGWETLQGIKAIEAAAEGKTTFLAGR